MLTFDRIALLSKIFSEFPLFWLFSHTQEETFKLKVSTEIGTTASFIPKNHILTFWSISLRKHSFSDSFLWRLQKIVVEIAELTRFHYFDFSRRIEDFSANCVPVFEPTTVLMCKTINFVANNSFFWSKVFLLEISLGELFYDNFWTMNY